MTAPATEPQTKPQEEPARLPPLPAEPERIRVPAHPVPRRDPGRMPAVPPPQVCPFKK